MHREAKCTPGTPPQTAMPPRTRGRHSAAKCHLDVKLGGRSTGHGDSRKRQATLISAKTATPLITWKKGRKGKDRWDPLKKGKDTHKIKMKQNRPKEKAQNKTGPARRCLYTVLV